MVFDSVSRMSRNAEEGIKLYEDLFKKGVNLIFLKESYINTEVYRQALKTQINININTEDKATNELMNTIIEALNKYSVEVARKQIAEAFKQSEKEVADLHQRTSEGMLTAKLNGKRIGTPKGAKLTTKKSKEAKAKILQYCKDFDGTLNDTDCRKLIGIAKNTYFKYKREIKEGII